MRDVFCVTEQANHRQLYEPVRCGIDKTDNERVGILLNRECVLYDRGGTNRGYCKDRRTARIALAKGEDGGGTATNFRVGRSRCVSTESASGFGPLARSKGEIRRPDHRPRPCTFRVSPTV